jgi:outer membrane protein insertion porin family
MKFKALIILALLGLIFYFTHAQGEAAKVPSASSTPVLEQPVLPAVENPAPQNQNPTPGDVKPQNEGQQVQPGVPTEALPEPQPSVSPTSLPGGTPVNNPNPIPENQPPAPSLPKVTAVEIEGNKEITTEEILKVIITKPGDPIDENYIKQDMQSIFNMGFFTDVKADTRSFLNGVKVVYRLLENPVLNKIEIKGNNLLSTQKILDLMETKPGKILNTNTLFSDVSEINRYYNEELGYLLHPSHITNLNWSEDGTLSFDITEGMVIKQINISGNTMVNTKVLRKLISSKEGEFLNQKTLQQDSSNIAKYYEDKDYILDAIRPGADPKDGTVTFQVIEAVCEAIKIEGNTKTKDYVIKRNLRTKPGMVLRRRKLQRDLERLNNLGFFESVNISPEPGTAPGKVILDVVVKEQKTGLATLGVGYTGGGSGALRSGITGAVSYNEKNLRGKGQGAGFQWQRGVSVDSLSLSFFDPTINDRLDSFGVSLYNSRLFQIRQPLANQPDQYALYDDKRAGGSVTFGRLLGEDFRAYLTYSTEKIEITQDINSTNPVTGLGKGTVNSITPSVLYDTRDDIFNPSEGNYFSGSYELAGKFLKGDYNFNKWILEYRKYFPLKRSHVIALRAWGGSINGNAPITESFYVGGTDTIRGYRDNLFWGTKMAVFNLEYRFPIAKIKMLSGALFGDAGNAWSPGQNSKLSTDAGAGVRLVFPTLGLGVIRIDYAFGQQGSRSSIGIGQTF